MQSPYISPLQAMMRRVFKPEQRPEAAWRVVEADLLSRAGTSYQQLAEKVANGPSSGYDLDFQLETIGEILEAGEFGAL